MVRKKNIGILFLISILIAGSYYITLERKSEDILPKDNNLKNNIIIEQSEESIKDSETISKEEQIAEIAIGKQAPNFTLENLNGEEVSLKDYRGKIVLINFWATWCVYCDIEMPDLDRLDKENDDLVVLAVDVMEDKETVEKYIKENGYEFEVALDEDGTIAKTYLVGGYPASYFVDEEGIFQGAVPGMMTYEQMNKVVEDLRENK